MNSVRLNLVLDTSAILDCTSEMFKDITTNERFGSLPRPVRVTVPYVVIGELRGKMRSDNDNIRRNATSAYNYFTQLERNYRYRPNFHVRIQTRNESHEVQRTFFPQEANNPYTSWNDSQILMCCVDLHYATNTETWLICQDRQLLARCIRSGLHGMTITTLQLAMDLAPYRKGHRLGNDYHVWKRTDENSVTISLGDDSPVTFTTGDMHDREHAYRCIAARRTVPHRHASVIPTETQSNSIIGAYALVVLMGVILLLLFDTILRRLIIWLVRFGRARMLRNYGIDVP